MLSWLRGSLLVAVAVTGLLTLQTQSKAAGSRVGDPIAEATKSDIKAYVNGRSIPSMNIGGNTAIIAEQLRAYGFKVAWLPYSRKLMITEAADAPAGGDTAEQALPDSAHASDNKVLATDIAAFFNGQPIRSFNLNGQTAILLNDLSSFGEVKWQPEQRIVSYTTREQPSSGSHASNPAAAGIEAVRLQQTDSVKLTIDFQEEQLVVNGENVGFGQDGLPYFDVGYFAERFGYVLTNEDNRYTVSNGPYSFTLDTESDVTQIYWGSQPESTVTMIRKPFVKDNRLYAYSIDLENLFGYTGIWHQEERKLDIAYFRYKVEDYGLPAESGEDELALNIPVLEKEPRSYYTAAVSIALDNGGIFGNTCSSWFGPAEPTSSGMYPTPLACSIRLGPGENPISEKIAIRNRIVYLARYSVPATFDNVPLKPRWEGFRLNDTASATIHSSLSKFELKGTAPSSFLIQILKWENGKGFDQSSAQKTMIETTGSGTFTMPIDLADASSGLYKVRVLLSRTVPRAGIVYEEADHFYVKLD